MTTPESSLAETAVPTSGAAADDLHAARRERLAELMGNQSAALIVSNPVRNRSNDTDYDYRPNSDLWYLTGFEEPEAALLLLPGHSEHPFVMFTRPRDPKVEIWDGERVGPERAPEMLGCQAAFPIHELDERLPALIAGREQLVYSIGLDPTLDTRVIKAVKAAQRKLRRRRPAPRTITEPAAYLHEMRLIKTPAEVDAMRHAVQISAAGHLRGIRMTRPGMTEYELQAEIEYVFKKQGARAPGYASIVGAGANACVLHYVENRATLAEGDLVLVDAGAEVAGYTGDITRTWPVSGSFNGHQRTIYDLVLRAQMEAIREVRPGLPWKALHETTVRVITEGLIDLDLIEGPLEEAIQEKRFNKYFMHGTGHWLGIDVHDVGAYVDHENKPRRLEPGMVFTIEPGIYFHPELSDAPGEWSGIGVRIEDDILVTDTGCEVLSKDVPKEPEELEELVGADL